MTNIDYYERERQEKLNPAYNRKIKKIFENIPKDVKNIADVGCGKGVITNELAKEYDVVGIDWSKNALKYVKNKTIHASCNNIPIESNSYDMTLCSEMLEHLDDDLFFGAIAELKRISKKYIFITVPNNENLEKLMIKCPSCNTKYNKNHHVRSLNIDHFKLLFPEYRIKTSFAFGEKYRTYNKYLINLKHRLTPSNSWIPKYWWNLENEIEVCINCSFKFSYQQKFNLISFSFDVMNMLVTRKKPFHLYVLLEKK